MKQTKTNLFKHTAFWVIAAVLILALIGGSVTLAEYTKSTRAKRVIATYLDGGILFSSNHLVLNLNTAQVVYKRFVYTADKDTIGASGAVTICNYAQGNPGRYYENNIVYHLTASIVKITEAGGSISKAPATAAQVGTKTVTISHKGADPGVTLSSTALSHDFGNFTLSHLSAATDICSLSFSRDFTNNEDGLCLYICAAPVGTYSDIYTIDAVFCPVESSHETSSNWKGEFNDDMSGGKLPGDYDGFNYIISGSGAGTCTLKWRDDKLTVSQIFKSEILSVSGSRLTTETVGGVTWNVLTFSVNSDTVNRYDLQFYYAEGASFSSWAELIGVEDDSGYRGGYAELYYEET